MPFPQCWGGWTQSNSLGGNELSVLRGGQALPSRGHLWLGSVAFTIRRVSWFHPLCKEAAPSLLSMTFQS